MRVCGIEISGSSATIVVLDGTLDDFQIFQTGLSRIDLNNSESVVDVRTFKDTFQALVINHNIEKIGIKRRSTRGQYAGGAVSFKIEGIIQVASNIDVSLIPPQTISSTLRNFPPPNLVRLFAYQRTAYNTAYTLLRIEENA